jgi:hypothetical protein
MTRRVANALSPIASQEVGAGALARRNTGDNKQI